MLISKNNKSEVTGWRETYISDRKIVQVAVNGNISMITTRDRKTGKVDTKRFFGKPLLPSDLSLRNR